MLLGLTGAILILHEYPQRYRDECLKKSRYEEFRIDRAPIFGALSIQTPQKCLVQ